MKIRPAALALTASVALLTTQIALADEIASDDLPSHPPQEPKEAVVIGGNDGEQASVQEAHRRTYQMTVEGLQELQDPASKQRENWFGATTPEQEQRVKSTLSAIQQDMENETFTYYVGGKQCRPQVFAHTPVQGHDIFLCQKFFRAPMIDSLDSKPGILLHEHTHKHEIDDLAYGSKKARSLAANAPQAAVLNADNYEYFEECLTWKVAKGQA